MRIKIKNKWVGDKSPVFIVAEAGINHNGSLRIAKKLIEKARESGADAIKFQTFKANDLASTKSKFFRIFKKLELNSSDFVELYDYAKTQDIIFFSTPFSSEAVDLLFKLKVPAFKIASGDLTNIPLLRYIASKKIPMIVSTGMANIHEVQNAINVIEHTGNKKIVLMHSVSSYPAPSNEANLKVIQTLIKKFHYPVGYSDNGENMLVPLLAVSIGAKIIEKHFTINRKWRGPDHKISSDPQQFKELVKNIRNTEKMIGDGTKRCQLSERTNRVNARRSITANVTIPSGVKITQEMIGIKRPATGIEPKQIHNVIGKITLRQIKSEEPVKWNYLK